MYIPFLKMLADDVTNTTVATALNWGMKSHVNEQDDTHSNLLILKYQKYLFGPIQLVDP